jgi:hypothetical protein
VALPRPTRLSAREARWLAVEAQQLARPRPRARSGASATQVERIARALGVVQLDAINVVERTQFLALFSRLGPYDRAHLQRLIEPGGGLWEYWGHAASLMPVDDEPLLRWRYEHGGTYVPGPVVKARWDAWDAESAAYVEAVMDEVRAHGPLTAGQLADPRRRDGEWWERRSGGREALARLHGRGRLAAWRRPSFETVYDLPERVLPPEVLARPTPPVGDAVRQLVLKAARASGVGTVKDLAGYYMIRPRAAQPVVDDLVRDGELVPIAVEGWADPAYAPHGVSPRRPTRTTATLISPFDSLVWDRARTLRLFGFEYRIEVYVPAPERVHGYYVLPVLLGDALVGRLDLKADRKASVLRVVGAYAEERVAVDAVAGPVAAELDALRGWLELDQVTVARRGNLAAAVGAGSHRPPAPGYRF